MRRLKLAWLRWRYVEIRGNGALSVDPRWYVETGAWARAMEAINAAGHNRGDRHG